MRKIVVIAIREYIAAVRTKAFIISVVLMPIFMGGSMIAFKLLENQVDTNDKKIAVVDRTGVLGPKLVDAAEARNAAEVNDATGKKVRPAYALEIVPPDDTDPRGQELTLSDRVKAKELHSFLIIGRDVINPGPDIEAARVAYHAENAAIDDVRRWIGSALNDDIRALRLAEAKLDAETVNQLTRYVPVESLGLVTKDAATGEIKEAKRSNEMQAILAPMAMMMMMFMLIMMGAQPLLSSVLEEKMQRIAEVLLGSVEPFQLMMGKLLGTVGVSFTVVGLYIAGAAFAARQLDATEYVPFHVLPWFFAFQVGAIFMYGAMFIAIGSACSELKEAQSLVMPVMILVVIPLFVWINVVREPLSAFSTWLSLVPPCTPMLMLIRQAAPGGVPAWQPWVGLLGVFLFTVLCVWMSGRIFRVGILMQGKPPKVGEMLRWAIRG